MSYAGAVESLRFERCHCTGVDRQQVVQAIRDQGLKTFDQVRRATGACFGCQTCRPELECLIAETWRLAEGETQRLTARPGGEAAGEPGPR